MAACLKIENTCNI